MLCQRHFNPLLKADAGYAMITTKKQNTKNEDAIKMIHRWIIYYSGNCDVH